MRLLAVFVTEDRAILDTIAERRTALVPSDLRADGFARLGGEEVVVSGYDASRGGAVETLLDHLATLDVDAASGVILLTDGSLPDVLATLSDVFSVNCFDLPKHGRGASNILGSILAKCLRAFRHYKTRFDDLKYQHFLRLPMRNFDAEEIAQMRALCRNMMNSDNFGRELDQLLGLLKQRQRPKKASSWPDIYLVDNVGKHFQLGHELHAQADSAIPPHNRLCVLGNRFRFGRRLDGTRHFNVSRAKGRMTGNYLDCHDVSRAGGGVTHLNMFTNDFF